MAGATQWEQTPELKEKVMRARAGLMYDQLPVTLGVSIFITVMLTAVLYDSRPEHQNLSGLVLWWCGVLLVAAARWGLGLWFARQDRKTLDGLYWAQVYTFGAFLSGAVLGGGVFAFLRPEMLVVSISLAVLVILTFGSVVVHAAYRWAHVAYVLPATLPMVLRCLMFDAELHLQLIGGFLPLVFVMTLPMAKRVRKSLIETMDSRAERERLIQDLTHQQQVAEEARQQAEAARALADEASAAKTRFFAAASHDLRQPVQAIEFFAANLRRETTEPAAQRMADNVLSGVRELSLLLGALLDYAKIDAARVQPHIRPTSLHELFDKMRIEFTDQAAKQGLVFRVAPCRAWVLSDPVLLERITRNLLHNALRYTPSGKILLGCRRLPGALRIEVHDTGQGIPRNKQDEVFREFVQLGNPERDNRKGLGLGLAIVKGLAELLDHPLGLQSQVGRGTVFRITVPMIDAPPETVPRPLEKQVPTLAYGTLLLVDDNAPIREAMAVMLRCWGYAVRGLESGEEALALMDNTGFEPDAVLLDYLLRDGRTGFDALAQIRAELGYAVPGLMITGDTDPQIRQRAEEAQLQLLVKPVTPDDLQRALARLLPPIDAVPAMSRRGPV